jgi:hypothetical protein
MQDWQTQKNYLLWRKTLWRKAKLLCKRCVAWRQVSVCDYARVWYHFQKVCQPRREKNIRWEGAALALSAKRQRRTMQAAIIQRERERTRGVCVIWSRSITRLTDHLSTLCSTLFPPTRPSLYKEAINMQKWRQAASLHPDAGNQGTRPHEQRQRFSMSHMKRQLHHRVNVRGCHEKLRKRAIFACRNISTHDEAKTQDAKSQALLQLMGNFSFKRCFKSIK